MTAPTILIAGASRGLGLAIAAEYLTRGWDVIGTVRTGSSGGLSALAAAHEGRVTIETLDIDSPDQIAALRGRLADRTLDMLFVNAGTAPRRDFRIGAVDTEEFMRVMGTNALGPMRVIEALSDRVAADGLIGAMSSGQGSIANNEAGLREVYRISKAALNMAMRSFAAREAQAGRATLLLAPGWIRTDMGGANAPFGLEETVPAIVDVMIAKRGRPGLEYLDRFGKTVPW